MLLAADAYVDATENLGWTALMFAASKGHLDIVQVITLWEKLFQH